MNQIILNISSSIEEQDIDFLSYYINFLKTIANKLDKNTLSQLFHKENNSFPLLDEANSFFNFNDVMIKNTARNIFLSIIKLNYEPVIQYICDIPRITDLILLCDNIKSYIIYMTSVNLDNNNIDKVEQKLKEVEESLVDDILFIQDILSIGIHKINYVLINCLFSIPLQYLFNCILKHYKINIVFHILNVILKHVKNECVNNLIFFVLYSSQIHENINAFIQKQEIQEIYNIIYLNKYISRHSACFDNLIFEEYIILVFNQNFLKSIRYLKDEEKILDEVKKVYNYIKERSDDINKDINLGIKIISEILEKNNKLSQTIKKMESYHNLISRFTGINIGISRFESNFSFLSLINENFIFYKNDIDLKNSFNINIQENIIKNECLKLIDDNNENNYINQIFFILQIMNSNKVSIELKKFLYLNISTYDIDSQNLISNESNEKEINNSAFYENKLIFRNLKLKNNMIEKDSDSSISTKKRNDLIKDFFGISETKTDYDMLNNYFSNTINEESNSIINNINNNLIPRPFNNNIIDDIINFKMFNYNNKNLNKLFMKYNTQNIQDENNNNNIKFHDDLLQKIFDMIFNTDKILTKLEYRISLEFIENLIFGVNNDKIIFYKDKYKDIIMNKYKQILQEINNILLNSNSTKTKIYKFAYQYFEECFSLNKKKSNIILNECLTNHYLFLLLNINQNKKDFFEIIDSPNKEHEKLQCLFQLLIYLCDLKTLFDFDKSKDKDNKDNITLYKNLLRNVEFPLRLINKEYDLDKKINIDELNVKMKPTPVIYKIKNSEFKNFFIFNYHNYLFVTTKSNKKDELNKSFFIIKYLIPLRQIVACADRGEPRALYLLNKNEIEATLFFDDVQNAINMKDNINNAIKLTNLKEFSEIKQYINKLIEK